MSYVQTTPTTKSQTSKKSEHRKNPQDRDAMERIWLKHYEEGVPSEIDMTTYSSLVELLEKNCREAGKRPAYRSFGSDLSYDDLASKSRAFAAFLLRKLGLKKGDRVAIMMPNLQQYPVALFGILRAGLTVVNINPLYTAPELKHILNDSGARAIVIVDNFAHVLEEALPDTAVKHIITTKIGDLLSPIKKVAVNFIVKYIKKMIPDYTLPAPYLFNDVISRGSKLHFQKPTLNHDDIAFLQYTGGTTGVSKGAVLSHGNMIANVLQLRAWLGSSLRKGREIMITALPLYHIFSLTTNCLLMIDAQALNILITNPRDLPNFIKELKKVKFTAITGVNTLFNAMLNYPSIDEVDFSHTHLAISGGMALQRSVADQWESVAGCPLIEGYGLTETSPVLTANPINIEHYTGSVGLPLPSTWIKLLDSEGNEVRQGEPGEICAKGPQVMKRYWNSYEETDKVFTEEGWLQTGDVATRDMAGYFYIVDRKKDTIIVSGFNVFPNEVEGVIAHHPGVLEVAVVGMMHEKTGEMVKAFIVRKDENLKKEDIITHCEQFLTRYKIPKEIEFRDTLPKTNVGKVLRRVLRDEV